VTGGAAARAHAAAIVTQVAHAGRSLDAALESLEPGADGRLVRSLAYGTVRWYLRLQALLKTLLSRRARRLHPEVEAVLLVGLHQLVDTDIAPHAAVAETVDAARQLGHPRAASLVNAVLRRAQREATVLLGQLDTDLAVRHAHPRWLAAQLMADWPEQFEAILTANNRHPPLWLRVNTRRITVETCRQRLVAAGHDVRQSDHAPEALEIVRPVDVRGLHEFTCGCVSVQDAAAQLGARYLAPSPGDRVLDSCAAPGGKTCHLLELQPELAELVAVDLSGARLKRVRENLERLGLAATLVAGDAARPAAWWDGRPFDRILLDVPCSATGVIRRHPDIKLLRRASDIPALAARQRELLQAAWPMLASGGRLLYASCSSLRAETRDVVAEFIRGYPEVRDITPALAGADLTGPGIAIPTGTAGMDGFYYACLEKTTG
jgi:16S rRNA (cytosine967-C5)-methyltransferase